MKFMKVAATAASAFALLATPVVASAADSKVSAASAKLGQRVGARAGAATSEESKAAGSGLLIGLIAVGVVVGGLAAGGVFDDDDDGASG